MNRLFVLSFENESDGALYENYYKYYTPTVKIEDWNLFNDGKSFLTFPQKI